MSKGKAISIAALAAAAVVIGVNAFLSDPPPAAAQQPNEPSSRLSFTILFGVDQQDPASWDGSIEAAGARIDSLEGWRLDEDDRIDGLCWKLSTRRANLTRGVANQRQYPALETGLYITADL